MHPAELAKASHMKPGDPRIAVLAEVSGLNRLERFYNEIKTAPGEDFIAALLARAALYRDRIEGSPEVPPKSEERQSDPKQDHATPEQD